MDRTPPELRAVVDALATDIYSTYVDFLQLPISTEGAATAAHALAQVLARNGWHKDPSRPVEPPWSIAAHPPGQN